MSASRAASHMNARGIAAKFAHMRIYPSDRRATLAHDFVERDERGKRVVDRHHARAGLCEALGHEAGIGAVEQAPVTTVKKHKNRRRFLGRRKNVEPLWLARAIGNGNSARKALTHARALRRISGKDGRDVRHGAACVELALKLSLIVVAVDKVMMMPDGRIAIGDRLLYGVAQNWL